MSAPRTIKSLVEDFALSVERQNEAIRRSDASSGNRFAQEYIGAFKELNALGEEGLDGLAALLGDPRRDVRTMAACFLLRHKTDEALEVLRASASEKGIVGMGAMMTLKRWECGSWNLDQI